MAAAAERAARLVVVAAVLATAASRPTKACRPAAMSLPPPSISQRGVDVLGFLALFPTKQHARSGESVLFRLVCRLEGQVAYCIAGLLDYVACAVCISFADSFS